MEPMWNCDNCGFVIEEEEEPEKCWKCEEENMEPLSGDEAEKIRRAWYTNDLHTELNTLLEDMQAIAVEGLEENLDPACVDIFGRAKGCSEKLQQAIKAELATHVEKDKWG